MVAIERRNKLGQLRRVSFRPFAGLVFKPSMARLPVTVAHRGDASASTGVVRWAC